MRKSKAFLFSYTAEEQRSLSLNAPFPQFTFRRPRNTASITSSFLKQIIEKFAVYSLARITHRRYIFGIVILSDLPIYKTSGYCKFYNLFRAFSFVVLVIQQVLLRPFRYRYETVRISRIHTRLAI